MKKRRCELCLTYGPAKKIAVYTNIPTDNGGVCDAWICGGENARGCMRRRALSNIRKISRLSLSNSDRIILRSARRFRAFWTWRDMEAMSRWVPEPGDHHG